jgi:hypothetical protein
VIVVATDDFELYHDVVGELRDRDVRFTTIESGTDPPPGTQVIIRTPADTVSLPPDAESVVVAGSEARRAVESAVSILRGGDDGRTIVGVDPGSNPGIAILVGDEVISAFQVPLSEAVETIKSELTDIDDPDPIVRIGDGARLQGAQLVNDLEDVVVEIVDEAGTTPYLGAGARGMGDVLAAINIARRSGEITETRTLEPTAGEIQRIKDRSRQMAPENRTIDAELARRVAVGELTLGEALSVHRGDE